MLRTSRSSTTTTQTASHNADTTSHADSGALADREGSFPTRARFNEAAGAATYLAQVYIPGLLSFAQAFEVAQGKKPCDQDFPVELVHLVPPDPTRPPLVIVGGMGPLAGAQAMQSAIDRFGDSREIVLLQLCNVPDRTTALNEDHRLGRPSDLHGSVVAAMAQGFANVEQVLQTRRGGVGDVVVACNTAHNFAPQAFELYRQQRGLHASLQMHSMVECVTRTLAGMPQARSAAIVVLGTDGTLRTRLYLNPLEAIDLTCAVPPPEAQQSLMLAIYNGVKAFNQAAVVEHGESLFRQLAKAGVVVAGRPFVVLAACTEVPEIIRALQDFGAPDVQALLASVTVADPMLITQAHLARADAPHTPDAT